MRVLRPSDKDMADCSSKGFLCNVVAMFSLHNLEKDSGRSRDPTKKTTEAGKVRICLTQKHCPVYQGNPSKRKKLPCSGSLEELKVFLNQQ